jgi:hypothetical protein
MPSNTIQKPLTAQDLSVMPIEWQMQIHEAALDLDEDKIHLLIAAIPQQEKHLSEGMMNLLNHFPLEAIALLTDPARSKRILGDNNDYTT